VHRPHASNNAGIVGLAYTQALRPGVKASFGMAIDTQRLNDRKQPSLGFKGFVDGGNRPLIPLDALLVSAESGSSNHRAGASFVFTN
jgi:hypothetical protein